MVPNPHLRNWSAQAATDGTNAAVTIKAPDAATDYVYVTKVVLAILTHANAKNVYFRDSTPTSYFGYNDLTVAAGANQGQPIEWNFGRRGLRMAVGKIFEVHGDAGGSGLVGTVYAEGYQSSI